jgi:hypothetical protein
MAIKLSLVLVAFGTLLAQDALAESHVSAITPTNSTMSTTARLRFNVVVPKVLYLRVGNAGATVNLFNINLGFVGLPIPSTNSVFNGTPATAGRQSTISDNDNNGLAGRVAARLWTNNGTAQLTCFGAPLTSGAKTEPISSIQAASWFTTDTLPHPGNTLACPSTAVGSAGVNDLNSSWFYYANAAQFLKSGTFTTRVTYTASQP